jgi:hypothetical protein
MGMAEDQRPPGADVVDELIAVGIDDVAADATVVKQGIAADRTERPDR